MTYRAALAICGMVVLPLIVRADPPPSNGLEKIIVTAKRRKQDVQKVPQTVDVVGGNTLRQYNDREFDEVQNLVSGLQLNDSTGRGQNVTLRGVTYNPDTTANPAIDIYVNEVPLSSTSSAFQDLYDIDQVEVIRGPQGTLRGRTSPAGAILIDTQKPDMEKTHGEFIQTFSDDGLFRTELAAGMPVIPDKLSVRVAGLFDQNDLYKTTDPISHQKDFSLQHSARITIEAKPNDDLDIVLMAQDSNDRTRQLFGLAGDGEQGVLTPADNIALTPGPYTFYDRTELVTLNATYHIGDGELMYTGGYQALKDEFQNFNEPTNYLGARGFNPGSEALDEGLEQLTQEIYYRSSGDQRLQYMGGLYYAHQDAFATVFTPSETIFAPPTTPSEQAGAPEAEINALVTIPQLVTDYGIFTDETFDISDNDVFEGGLRWQDENQYRASGLTVNIPPIYGGQTLDLHLVDPQNQHEEYHAWTGLASYTHAFTPNIRIYTSYGESYRPGGIVVGISLPLPESFLLFKPEESYDFEIGVKTTWDDGRVRVNADIFHQSYSNYIGRLANLYTTLGDESVTTNGNAISRGAEGSIDYAVTDFWRLGGNATYSDAHYVNAKLPCNDYNGSGVPNTEGTQRIIGDGVSSYCIENGSLGAPPLSLRFTTEYSLPIGTQMEGFARALYAFSSTTSLDTGTGNLDPRNIVNLYLGARGTNSAWEITSFVKNLFDVVGYTNLAGPNYVTGFTTAVQNVDIYTGYHSSKIMRPREIGVTLAYRF